MDRATHIAINRRQWLQAGSLACLATGLPNWLGAGGANALAEPAATPARHAVRSCILIFYYGGPSQFETYDPKPLAPAEVRGEYAQIPTAVPGGSRMVNR